MTKSEKLFQRNVRDLGCIVCRVFDGIFTPCSIHHMLNGNRRIGEMSVLGLCPTHHNTGVNSPLYVSRHPWRRQFQDRYGTEKSLLAQTHALLINAKGTGGCR